MELCVAFYCLLCAVCAVVCACCVLWRPEGTIVGIEERQNYIVRKSVNLSKQTHIIASNIDQVFLLITLHNPPTFTAFIDRFLVTAEAYHIPAVLVFNKMDTCSPEQENEIDALATIYQTIGYKTLKISATEGQNIDEIKSMMQGKVSMFSGHSGVGKSTLIDISFSNMFVSARIRRYKLSFV